MAQEYKKLKDYVWAKTDGQCWYCGKSLSIVATFQFAGTKGRPEVTSQFCIDHVDPQFRNGSDDIDNLVPACRSCNSSKRYKTVEEWRDYLTWLHIGKFSESQIEWLRSHGIDVPQPKPVVFYFETIKSD